MIITESETLTVKILNHLLPSFRTGACFGGNSLFPEQIFHPHDLSINEVCYINAESTPSTPHLSDINPCRWPLCCEVLVVCVCGLWSSCAVHIIQMWCSNTQCGNTSGREMKTWGMSLRSRSLMETSSQMALCCTVWSLVVSFGSLGESWIKLSLKGKWSALLAHVGLRSKVLVKIRFDFCIPDKLSLQEMKSSYQESLSSFFPPPLLLSSSVGPHPQYWFVCLHWPITVRR